MEVVAEGDESSNDSSMSSKDGMDIDLAAEAKKAVLNFEEGLSDLLKISQSFKSIDDDFSPEPKDKTSATIGRLSFFLFSIKAVTVTLLHLKKCQLSAVFYWLELATYPAQNLGEP